MRRVKKACVSSSAMPARWSTQPSRVTLMLKVRRPMAASLSLLPPPKHARLDPVDVTFVDHQPAHVRVQRHSNHAILKTGSLHGFSDEPVAEIVPNTQPAHPRPPSRDHRFTISGWPLRIEMNRARSAA